MTEFVIGPGGTIIPAKQYLDDISEDGGKPEKSTKRDLYHELSTTEKVKVNKFLKEHPELTTSPERAKLFQEKAAKELIEVRNEDFKRTKEDKEPLSRQE